MSRLAYCNTVNIYDPELTLSAVPHLLTATELLCPPRSCLSKGSIVVQFVLHPFAAFPFLSSVSMASPNHKIYVDTTAISARPVSEKNTPLSIATGRHDFSNKASDKQLSPVSTSDSKAKGHEPVAKGLRSCVQSQSHWQGSNMVSWQGKPQIKGSSEGTRMALLTLCLIGIQYVLSLLGRLRDR